jgi:superfamily II DNA or RNA helicase
MERPVHLTCAVTRHQLDKGAIVRIRNDRWRVLRVTAYEDCAVAELAGTSAANRGTSARFILPCEAVERIPAPATNPRRVRPAVFGAVARRVLSSAAPAWTSLRAAAAARITLLPYQLEPALAMTRGLSCRFLLADAVGLGKTIQAGLLAAELIARDPDARILIVTPAGLRDQWREELHERFDIEADVLDAPALARAAAMLPAGINPWAVPRVILTSIDFVKRADVMRALEPLVWDLVAFDEAHGLAGRSDRATAAELLARRGRRVVAITATPHSGDSNAYDRLLALGRLSAQDPILIFRRSREDAGLSSQRVARVLHVRPRPHESAVHRALDEYARRVFREAPTHSAPAARLAMIVLARRAASSAASLVRSVERRMALLDTGGDESAFQLVLPLEDGVVREDEEPGAELAAPGLADVFAEQRWLQRVLSLGRAAMACESKIVALERLLRRSKEPAIVFTEYRDTLERLAGELALPHGRSRPFAMLHGGMSAAERAREARRFTHGNARILLATDAASEGLNLHHRCRLVVSLEMPWTPLRLEQRIGRVDRLGQQRRVHAIGLVGRGTAEEAVVAALMARAATAEREAPFGAPKLRDDAEAEAARLATCRALASDSRTSRRVRKSTTPRTTNSQFPKQPWDAICSGIGRVGSCELSCERPVVCSLGKGRSRVYVAVCLGFVDASGVDLWDTVVGARLLVAGRSTTPAICFEEFSSAMASLTADASANVAAAGLAEFHERLRSRLIDDLRGSVAPLIVREEAMLHALQSRRGRLASPLVQAGLFDRRALRGAEAQQRIVDEAAAAAAERVLALRRFMDPAAGMRRLVFAVVV